MKKTALLLALPLLLLTSCSNEPNYKNYTNKDYLCRGFVCRFYKETMIYVDENTLHPCRYEKMKPLAQYTFEDTYSWVNMDYDKEYVYVYVQGWKHDSTTNYQPAGFFYDKNSFVGLYYGNHISDIFIANNAH